MSVILAMKSPCSVSRAVAFLIAKLTGVPTNVFFFVIVAVSCAIEAG